MYRLNSTFCLYLNDNLNHHVNSSSYNMLHSWTWILKKITKTVLVSPTITISGLFKTNHESTEIYCKCEIMLETLFFPATSLPLLQLCHLLRGRTLFYWVSSLKMTVCHWALFGGRPLNLQNKTAERSEPIWGSFRHIYFPVFFILIYSFTVLKYSVCVFC